MELLDPKNDYVFKRILAHSPQTLAALIGAVRQGEPAVQVLQVLNPNILAEDLTGKAIELDVLAREDGTGRLFNVEIQVRRFPRWSVRSSYYLARLLSTQITSGQEYTALKPVVGIHLLDFDLFEAVTDQTLWHFEMRDRRLPAVRLGDELQLHVLELRKADRLARAGGQAVNLEARALAAWVAFLEHWKEPDVMSQIDYPPVREAMAKLQEISLSEEERYRAIARERALIDHATLLGDAQETGRTKGKAEALSRLLIHRFGTLSPSAQATISSALEPQLDAWLDGVFEAVSVEALLQQSPPDRSRA